MTRAKTMHLTAVRMDSNGKNSLCGEYVLQASKGLPYPDTSPVLRTSWP